MKSLWNDEEAAQFVGDLAERVYTSHLLGRDPSLVLHGGGNTSVKARESNIFGEQVQVIYVKGRGRDLANIDESGFSPCRLAHLLRLSQLQALSDTEMESEFRLSLTRPSAPAPSVEALLHAILPAKFVDHTHADALISIMNAPDGLQHLQDIYGDTLVIVPYAKPGFKLVRSCVELFQKDAQSKTIGMVLMHHGLLSFGDTARVSYERMIEIVDAAEKYLNARAAWQIEWRSSTDAAAGCHKRKTRVEIAELRRAVCDVAGAPMIMRTCSDAQALGFARRGDVVELSQRGGATPDHVIRTKRLPLVGRDVTTYAAAYRQYFLEHGDAFLTMVDAAPRVILDPEFGMCVLGSVADEAAVAEDIYRHTMDIILRAEKLGGWRALSAQDFFDVEYWDMERAKLRNLGGEQVFAGEVALVTGAASGIGRACIGSLLSRGAAVIALDIAPAVTELHHRKDYLGIHCDLTNEQEIKGALEDAVRAFGGLDMLILNAGIFPPSAPVAGLTTESWRKTMCINLDANLVLFRECHPLLKVSPRGGRIVLIGSKNVTAPGPGAAAYSASKAALQQLARIAALEWGEDHIRINTIHPNAVFDTGIWTPEVLAARAAIYKMSVGEYKTNNVLKVEVTSIDVAELASDLCGPNFSKTTGAQIPVDGGNVRVI